MAAVGGSLWSHLITNEAGGVADGFRGVNWNESDLARLVPDLYGLTREPTLEVATCNRGFTKPVGRENLGCNFGFYSAAYRRPRFG